MAKIIVSDWGVKAGPAERHAGGRRPTGHAVWFDAWKIEIRDPIIKKIFTNVAIERHAVAR